MNDEKDSASRSPDKYYTNEDSDTETITNTQSSFNIDATE